MSGLWYMPSPYTNYPRGREQAYHDACLAAAEFIKRGIHVFSPVAHSHPIAELGGIDPLDHEIWMPLDLAILDRFDGLVIPMMLGWRESEGVTKEIKRAEAGGKTVSYFSWPMLSESKP